jgi:histidinol-phosphate phosphatase family protein
MQKLILVIRFGSLGDVILTSPAVLNLSFKYPDAHIVYLTKERFGDIVAGFDGVDEVVTIPDHATGRELLASAMKTEDRGIDTIVDLHGSIRSWITRRLVTANVKAVYPKRRLERQKAVRRKGKIIPPTYPHTIDLYNTAVREAGGEAVAERPVMAFSDPPESLTAFIDSDGPCIAIAPGAAHATKQWRLERFVETAAQLQKQQSARIVWVVTAADADRPEFAVERDTPSVRVLSDRPIPELASVLARCDLLVSNDSGIAHLSSAVGTPVLALFGPTHPVLGFAPRGLHDQVVEVDEWCRPCSLHGSAPCFREEQFCFTRISPEHLVRLASGIVVSRPRRNRALFVDRDGTLIKNKHYLSDPDEVEFIDGSIDALREASEMGYRIVLISNQSGVGRGYFSVDTVNRVNGRIVEQLQKAHVEVDGVYFCPHYSGGPHGNPFAIPCRCRKPGPGMAEAAAQDLAMDLRRSVVIGDSHVDVNLARVIGASAMLVRTGYGSEVEAALSESVRRRCDIADDLRSAVGLLP